ncbi:MAG: hypothetical protein AAFQ88_01445 [Pseudomonadota bacterium]
MIAVCRWAVWGFLALTLATNPALADGGGVGASAHPVTKTAQAQIAQVQAAVARYRDFDAAMADGWFPFGGEEPLVGQHFHHADSPVYTSETPLDFARPTNLMYAKIDGAMVLTGVTFGVMLRAGEPLPEGFDGAADEWHMHDLDEIIANGMADRPIVRWLTKFWLHYLHPAGREGRTRRAMLHVWVTVENPEGPFALQNPALGYLKHGLNPALAADRDAAVARGLALAAPSGCEQTYRPRLLVSGASNAQYRSVMEGCEAAAQQVRQALRWGGLDTAAPVAEEAADRIASLYWITLDRDQHARVGAMADHGNAFCEPAT